MALSTNVYPQKIAAGDFHNLLIKEDGSLWAWGENSYGELGIGVTGDQSSPVRVGVESDWTKASAGWSYSVGIKTDGTLWAWGRNQFGRLGDGTSEDRPTPTQIGTSTDWLDISAGREHVLAIRSDGTLWAWGRNNQGQLGDGSQVDKAEPVQIGEDDDWKEARGGFDHSIAQKNDGTLWVWGNNKSGSLGYQTATDCIVTQVSNPSRTYSIAFSDSGGDGWNGALIRVIIDGVGNDYTLEEGFGATKVVYIPLGTANVSFEFVSGTADSEVAYVINSASGGAIMAEDGPSPTPGLIEVDVCIGQNTFVPSPVRFNTNTDWSSFSAGYNFNVAVKDNGTLWSWGENSYGQLGSGSFESRYEPRIVGSDTDWIDAVAGYYNAFAIKSDGSLWSWGLNGVGHLGIGSQEDRLLPVEIPFASGWAEISVGNDHSIAISDDGMLWSWGYNGSGQLGIGNEVRPLSPIKIGNDYDWVNVIGNVSYTLAQKSNGTLYGWGSNLRGRLGNGTEISENAPIQINAVTNQKKISSYRHVLVLKNDGTIWSWGENFYGQVGDGTIIHRLTAVQVGEDTDWTDVFVGYNSSYALKSDGKLWVWGNNSDGQLGMGTTESSSVPVKLNDDTDWLTLSAGFRHTLAVKADGTLWAWGYNYYGQLGDGSNNSSLIPIQIGTDTDWSFVEAGDHFSLAQKTDGSLWSWGQNDEGQLGDGTTDNRLAPVRIGGQSDWAVIDAERVSMAIKTDGSLWGWGGNEYGQVGDGTTTDKLLPTRIGNDTDWTNVDGGGVHTVATKSDGSLWAWGVSAGGRLGDGNGWRVSPVRVTTMEIDLSTRVISSGQVGSDVCDILTVSSDSDATPSFSLVAGQGSIDNALFTVSGSSLMVAATLNRQTQATYSVRIQAIDEFGNTFRKTFILSWDNSAPTTIELDVDEIAENLPENTKVGLLSSVDGDEGDTFTYSLVAGEGSMDNGSFFIVGDELRTAAQFDFETKSSFSVRIETRDALGAVFSAPFAVTVTDANDPPTSVSVSNAEFTENLLIGSELATLSTSDQDETDSHTYTLVTGEDDTDNASFTISGDKLLSDAVFDFETKMSYTVRIQTKDLAGAVFSESFSITITDANDAPTALSLSASEFSENLPVGRELATLSTSDQDETDSQTYTLVTGEGDADNVSFTIGGDKLLSDAVFDFETKTSYTVRIQTKDLAGAVFSESFSITITDVNDAPTALSLSASEFSENLPVGRELATLSTSDQDETDSQIYTLVTGEGDTDNASFTISGDKLLSDAVFDFETKTSYTVRIQTKDLAGAVFSESFSITITDANDAPTALSLSASEFSENLPVGSELATLSTSDQDETDSHTYTLVTSEGDTDNASFTISGNKLLANAVFDFENKAAYTIRIQTEDSGGEVFSRAFALTIINANDFPSDILLSSSVITQQIVAGIEVGVLSTTDQDASNTHTYELVVGDGSTDNTLFTITDNKLLTNEAIVNNKKEAYSVRIQSKDVSEGVFSKAFSISTANLKAEQVITFELPANLYPDESPVALSASSTSELPVSFVLVSGLATLDGNQLTLTGSGEVVVMATQAGNDDFLPAGSVSRTLIVKSFLSLAVTVNKSEDVVLDTGTATLLSSEGSIIKEATVGEGSLQMDGLKAGNYILQITPGEEESELVNTTYYPFAVSFEEAEPISIVENTALSMTMVAKEEVVQGLETPLGSLQLYPNPASDQLVVSLSLDELKALESIRLYSMDGQFLRNLSVEKGQASLYLDVKTLEPGVYFLRLTFQDGISTGKFLKE
ncbi:T9SS type A sorting domain-containing protein [Imperialibacter roseus]|uniref:T9SS type A sorting domain-containing protein n=1 Tax=Imperialibacter roseus TaxID=1324217 RepID=A0ABZ0INS7_9BACT|nr:T9SS type A sorting domain-containing protein [Imperialibacter roseus]WOK05635.1 T9SS type A sorting domain-containing protein [Imperialibacter roseus]